MNLNGLINMVVGKLLNRALNMGMRKMGSIGSKPAAGQQEGGKPSPQQRQQDKMARETVKRARQAARITRRLGR